MPRPLLYQRTASEPALSASVSGLARRRVGESLQCITFACRHGIARKAGGMGLLGIVICLSTTVVVGCKRQSSIEPQSLVSVAADGPHFVIAQGQLMPAGGFIQLGARPGDVVQEVLVEVGDRVKAGDRLIVMRSQALLDAQRSALNHQRAEAVREQTNAIAMAERQIAAAELQVQHAAAQQAAIERKSDLLNAAEAQVAAGEEILKQLEAISQDELTSEFVGKLEVDQQRLKVSESRLAFQQQQAAHEQSMDDLQWVMRAAEAELANAQAIKQNATESEALKLIDLKLEALELENEAAVILAPQAGVILAVNATKGEASIQMPLIEMADDSQIVCEVEVNEMDAALVEKGQDVEIESRAFEQPLHGTVGTKYQLVGRPQLRPLDPLARVDYRAVTAIIKLDNESRLQARSWLQLQVEVKIHVD
ncbi:MAG: efflux RND transporter periplasmic adaptor subunit [Pirellulaceae bacterium]